MSNLPRSKTCSARRIRNIDELDEHQYEGLHQTPPYKKSKTEELHHSRGMNSWERNSKSEAQIKGCTYSEGEYIEKEQPPKDNPRSESPPNNADAHNSSKKETQIKKYSIDFDTFNESIFDVSIELGERDPGDGPEFQCTSEDTEEDRKGSPYQDDEDDQTEQRRDNLRKNNHIGNRDYDQKKGDTGKSSIQWYNSSDNSSHSSLDVNEILQTRTNERVEKKNRNTYILQHKERIKERKNEKKNRKNNSSNSNNLKNNFLKISKTAKDNVKRASIATVMLENLSNRDPDSDISSGSSEHSHLSENHCTDGADSSDNLNYSQKVPPRIR
ncbi:conserved Plasmodium protein, unknown function [Plasmodium knowlesi strain H]|uniref:Uncharacterized protein n=3 Tax=Plasmodium knowlesi TaxID=5850 RepID=A0A5K1UJD1_PLAKH|nr:conserved Plasmodium protein, unknown function [Plasmodium knowlesi strain H]OTN64932.1 Uncharacterized protein PKNOH_S120160200 [Plasmodium knowlesi]CAA9988458.1 conserved Plasmodium protein, unknown function [Plasmodium knowlesi strain H]SBO19808.1 conserved Plasmodium protein, unknown function [Plasmodium knowlesi strain H]SBO20455.1 conserved Plasmodium protein, unknown function [Plasmodium knowlesi strain H]VVS77932.1 conserved Plasmodium protein, unknown function [Plasmodium knowlesi |eukprot:XP_002259439.1 hypothetical protein, conserved in Plasmodium species [Plasmodium knowlesi strain H]